MPRVNRVMLRDGYRNIWRVEVDINGDGEWSFKEGWPHFYKDNCLKPLDFMVFECKDCSTTNCVFDFKVLGENACEKKGVPNFKIKEEYEIEEDLNKDNDDDGGDYYYYEEEDDDDLQEEDESCRSNKSNIFRSGVANQLINNRPCFISRSRSRENELLIPKKVMVRYKRKLPERLFLVDVRGNKWETVIKQRKDGRVCCSGGWRSLCDANNINKDDRCICEKTFIMKDCSTSNCVFNFKVLGENACEKKEVPNFKIKEEYEIEEDLNKDTDDDGGDDEEEEEVCRSNKSNIFRSGVANQSINNRPFFISRSRSQKNELLIPKKVMVRYKLKLPERLFLVDVRGNKWEAVIKQRKDGRVCCSGGWRSLCDTNNINKDDRCICEFILEGCQDPCILVRVVDAAGTSRNNRSYQKKHVSDCYGGDIFRQGQATRPTNIPFFVSRSRPRRYELMIPKEVRKDYKLKLPDVLFLVDERGNKWETKVKKWKDGRVMCSGGWRSLCNVNNINKDDTCICEFFLETDDPAYILVRPLDATI
ncbi:hypothetical protein ACS0TY_014641 [Phlomoides rotata]